MTTFEEAFREAQEFSVREFFNRLSDDPPDGPTKTFLVNWFLRYLEETSKGKTDAYRLVENNVSIIGLAVVFGMMIYEHEMESVKGNLQGVMAGAAIQTLAAGIEEAEEKQNEKDFPRGGLSPN
jgi:hypothetical protein